MNRFRASSWTYRVELPPADKMNLKKFVAEETAYYNAVVGGLSGPMRTIPDTLAKMTGRWETLVGEVAATGIDVRSIKPTAIPVGLDRYRDLLFQDNRLSVDTKTMLIFDIVAQAGAVHPEVRRGMAIELVKNARDQSALLTAKINREDQVYRFAVETLTPHDYSTKRHVQLPRSVLAVEEGEDGQTTIRVPYFTSPITVQTPPIPWSYLILRSDDDGKCTMEMSRETSPYLARRSDTSSLRRAKRRKTA